MKGKHHKQSKLQGLQWSPNNPNLKKITHCLKMTFRLQIVRTERNHSAALCEIQNDLICKLPLYKSLNAVYVLYRSTIKPECTELLALTLAPHLLPEYKQY